MFKKLKKNWPLILIAGLILSLAGYLRFYKLSSLPPAPYWEEVALGYDAYSISQTLKDHHGNFLPLVAFESFGDWKPSGYFYVLAPFVKLLGLKVLIVRLPSALAGMAIVIGLGVLAWILVKELKLFPNLKKHYPKTFKYWVGFVALFVGAVSSWAIMFSRAAWEANLATAFLVWGVITFFWFEFKQRNSRNIQYLWLTVSVFLFAYSMYTYHAARVVAPILLAFLMLEFLINSLKEKQKRSWQAQKQLVLSLFGAGVFFVILISPLLIGLRNPQVSDRFTTTSVFNDTQVIEKSNRLKKEAGYSLFSRVFYHRYVFYSQEILKNFFKHLNLDFLFIHGDANRRHSTGYVGELYYLDFFFILLALYGLARWQRKLGLFLFVWLVVSIIPSSLTLEGSPHALRILPGMPAWLLLVSFGILFWLDWLVKKVRPRLFVGVNLIVLITYSLQVAAFWRFYTQVYPKLYAHEWQYGYKDAIKEVKALKAKNPNYDVYISRSKGRPAMYWWFYTQENPGEVQAQDKKEAKSDMQNEFLTYKNMTFFDKTSQVRQKSVVMLTPKEAEKSGLKNKLSVTKVVKDLEGKPVWLIGVVN